MKSNFKYYQRLLLMTFLLASTQGVFADEKTIDVFKLNNNVSKQGMGEKIGTITFTDSSQGLVIKPHLSGLAPGDHGFHIHENPACEGGEKDGQWTAGLAAGGHLDPQHAGKHLGPYNHGHLGDLPVLVANKEGNARKEEIAPRLKVSQIIDHSIVIHADGDNYSDVPPLGGGGERIACGVIK